MLPEKRKKPVNVIDILTIIIIIMHVYQANQLLSSVITIAATDFCFLNIPKPMCGVYVKRHGDHGRSLRHTKSKRGNAASVLGSLDSREGMELQL